MNLIIKWSAIYNNNCHPFPPFSTIYNININRIMKIYPLSGFPEIDTNFQFTQNISINRVNYNCIENHSFLSKEGAEKRGYLCIEMNQSPPSI